MKKINKRGQGLPSSTRIMLLVSARDNATIVEGIRIQDRGLVFFRVVSNLKAL
jgi:hypothetical protein